MSTFGERLRALRKKYDMTQEQVAKKLNIVRSTYAYYETGKTSPDFNTVVRLARLFNVTTDYLLNAEPVTPMSMHDASSNIYTPGYRKSLGAEWSLRESEQKLIIAFRYLGKEAQKAFLKKIEKAAAERYEKKNKKKEKQPPSGEES